jgi:hypothetical protein
MGDEQVLFEYRVVGAPGWPDPFVTFDAAGAKQFQEAHGGELSFRVVSDWVQTHVVDDPRELGGDMAGPGGPFDFGQTVIDARQAVLVDAQEWAKVDPEAGARGQDEMFAGLFQGRINQTQDRARVLLFGNLDFLAATITEIHGIAERAGLNNKLMAACEARWADMPHRRQAV